MVTCGTTLLKKDGVDAVVQAVKEYRTAAATQHKVKVLQTVKITQVRYSLHATCMPRHATNARRVQQVYIPIDSPLSPDPAADFQLGDRVVCCVHSGVVPFGLEGTVIGTYGVVCFRRQCTGLRDG